MRSFVRVRAFFLLLAGMSASMTGVRVARADGSSPSTPAAVETDDVRFQRLKAEGDRALAEKRLNDAIEAYNAAREIRRDPLTAGRMGLAISFFDDPRAFVDAASLLYEAVADAVGASSQEKDAFFAAYKRVRKQVCKLSIYTNAANASIDLGDGYHPNHAPFFVFVKQGKGEGVAKLEGRQDIRKTWDCTGNHDIELRFDFPTAETAPAKTITVKEKGKETVKIVHVPIPAENPIDTTVSNANRLSVWFGPSVVFGVAQSSAYGLSVSSAYNFAKWSMMLGARGAYAFGPIERDTIDTFAFTGMVGPCFRKSWFSACVFGNVNIVKWIPTTPVPDDFYVPARAIPGIGIGARGSHWLSNNFAIYGGADAILLSRELELSLTHSNSRTQVMNGDQLLLTLSLGVEFER